jgi:RimJ/RimL family protein N-acetyltransferase
MNIYKVLNNQFFSVDRYSLVPIRFEDRYSIMNWRNEQIFHLRQVKLLNKRDQDEYFKNVVSKLFNKEHPNQLLFSLIQEDVCIGYGGLVHINWVDKTAEISFIMDTLLEEINFDKIWEVYLSLIEKVAFQELKLNRIYTFAYDVRPHLYVVLQRAGFKQESRLKNQYLHDNKYVDALIHSKFNYND